MNAALIIGLISTYLLLDLKLFNCRHEFRQNLICATMVFELRSHQIGNAAQRLGRV
jgi:hypothetical protein